MKEHEKQRKKGIHHHCNKWRSKARLKGGIKRHMELSKEGVRCQGDQCGGKARRKENHRKRDNIQWRDQEEKVTRQPKRSHLSGKIIKYREKVHFSGARQKRIERGE